jgi:ribosomal protein L9
MPRLPKIPKGLKASVNREKRLLEKKKAVQARKALIAKLKAERDKLRKQRRGY